MKKRSVRRKPLINTFFLILIFVIVLLAGILGIIKIRQQQSLDLSFSFVSSSADEKSQQQGFLTAAPFAEQLCVANENIGLGGISLSGSNVKSVLFDIENKQALFAQNLHEKSYPASITKIMTAILAIKYGDMNDIVTISQTAVTLEAGSQVCGLEAGDRVTMDELFHGLLVYSGNDAAMAIAEHIGGSVEHFVEMMNEEVQNIGATNTNFVNPSGLHDENHYTTAYDIYLMLNEALKYEYFVDTMQLGMYNMTITRGGTTIRTNLDSTDHYLTGDVAAPENVTVLGGKTGTTSQAGSCLAILSQNAYGELYVSIVLNATTKANLYQDMNQLLGMINS